MICPECGGKMNQTATVYNPNEQETYRRRECVNCGYPMYTVEYEVEPNERFEMDWAEHCNPNKKKGEKHDF